MEALKDNKKSIEKARKEIIKRINKLRAEKKKIDKAWKILDEVEEAFTEYREKIHRHTAIYEADMLICKGMDKIRISKEWIDDEIRKLMDEEGYNNGKLSSVSNDNENVEQGGICRV